MKTRTQVVDELAVNFEELRAMQDESHSVVILLGNEKEARILSSAPNVGVSIYLQVSALADQLSKVEGDPEAVSKLKSDTVTTLVGMLGIDLTDEVVATMRTEIEETKKAVQAQAAQ